MGLNIAIFYGSYRRDRQGIRLARYLVDAFTARGDTVTFVDACDVGLPMLDRMYKEYPKGEAPEAMERVADVIRRADAFVFVTGEYNWSVPPGLKNLTDHFLEEWFWRPAAIASYSAGAFGGVRAQMHLRAILGEMGMVVTSSTLPVPRIAGAFDDTGKPMGDGGRLVEQAFPNFAADLAWWAEAAKAQRAAAPPPY
jgi:NAD(P)H-dependent FMN reductase